MFHSSDKTINTMTSNNMKELWPANEVITSLQLGWQSEVGIRYKWNKINKGGKRHCWICGYGWSCNGEHGRSYDSSLMVLWYHDWIQIQEKCLREK